MKIMTAKFKSKCFACDVRIKVGDAMEYHGVSGSKHVDCAAAVDSQIVADLRKTESITQLGDFTDVYALFEKAAKGGKWPRITINADGFEFYLYMSGPSAMIPDVLNVKTPGGHGHLDWYGRITPGGAWDQRHKEVDERMADALCRLAMDPVGTAAMYGKLSGKCCFCKKQLTDEPSVDAGYGPVCAKRWGLAWGGKQNSGLVLTDEMMELAAKDVVASGVPAVTAMQKTVTGQPAVINSFVQAANAPYVMAGNEYAGPLQVSEPGPKEDCEYCDGTKLIDGQLCMGCAHIHKSPQLPPMQWNPGAAPIENPADEPITFGALGKLIKEDAAAPKETVTLKTKMIVAKVNVLGNWDIKV